MNQDNETFLAKSKRLSNNNLNNDDDVVIRNTNNLSMESSYNSSSNINDSNSSRRKRSQSSLSSSDILLMNRPRVRRQSFEQCNSATTTSEGVATLFDPKPSIDNPIPITSSSATPTEVTAMTKSCSNDNEDCIEYKTEYNDYSNVPIEFFEQKAMKQPPPTQSPKQQMQQQKQPNTSACSNAVQQLPPTDDNNNNNVDIPKSSSSSSKTTTSKSKFRRHNKFPTTLHRMLQYCEEQMNMKVRVVNDVELQEEDSNKNKSIDDDEDDTYYYPYDIIRWDYHGRSFSIYDKQKLLQYLFPKFYPYQKEYSSFQRQLNLYGFINISVYNSNNINNSDNNNDISSMQSPRAINVNKQISNVQKQQPQQQTYRTQYYHELFLRTRSDLCIYLCRLSSTLHHHNLAPTTSTTTITGKGTNNKKKHSALAKNIHNNDNDNDNENQDSSTPTTLKTATSVSLMPNFDSYPPLLSSSSKQITEYTNNDASTTTINCLTNTPNVAKVDDLLGNSSLHRAADNMMMLMKSSSIANHHHPIVNHHDNNSISRMTSFDLHPDNVHSDTQPTTTLLPLRAQQPTNAILHHRNNSIVNDDDIINSYNNNNNMPQHAKAQTQQQQQHPLNHIQQQQQHHLDLIHQQQLLLIEQQQLIQQQMQNHHPTTNGLKYYDDEVMTDESIHEHLLGFHKEQQQQQQEQEQRQQEQEDELQQQHKLLQEILQQQQVYQHQEQQMQQKQHQLQQQQRHQWQQQQHLKQKQHEQQQLQKQQQFQKQQQNEQYQQHQQRYHQHQQQHGQQHNELDQMQWHCMQQVYESQVRIGIEHLEKRINHQVEPQNIQSSFDENELRRINSNPVLLPLLPNTAGHHSNSSNLSYRLTPFQDERIDLSIQNSDVILSAALNHSSNQFNVPREQSVVSTAGETKLNDMVESPSSQFLTNKITALDWNHQTSSPQSRHPANLDVNQGSPSLMQGFASLTSSQRNKEESMKHQNCLGNAIINPNSPSFGNNLINMNKNQMSAQNLDGATPSSSDTDASGMVYFLEDVDL